jgi:C3HC zinc finger-like
MNATKRKFNVLLNSFGSKSTTTLPSTSGVNNGSTTGFAIEGDTDLQSKRRRVVRPLSALSQASPQSRSTLAYSAKSDSMGHNKSLSLASADPTRKDSPKYAPWDRAAFLKRLESFKSVTEWTPKPAKVNEVEWAKRGWVCRGPERVRCELCNVEILVKLNVKEVEGEEKMLLNASEIGTYDLCY